MSGGTDDVSDDGSGSNYAVMFNLLYSVYSIPNIILPFFGGECKKFRRAENYLSILKEFTKKFHTTQSLFKTCSTFSSGAIVDHLGADRSAVIFSMLATF